MGTMQKSEATIFQNTRGVKIRGTIDDKVYFFTSIYENQQQFLPHEIRETNRINAIPGQGFYKPYQSGVIHDLKGFDYLNSQAHIGVKVSASIDAQLGHGRHFIGDGFDHCFLATMDTIIST